MENENPYQPPQTASAPPEQASDFSIGSKGVLVIGIFSGLIVGVLIVLTFGDTSGVFPMFVPLVVLYVAIMILIDSTTITNPKKALLGFALTIPAYVLYVPICTTAAVFTEPIVGANGYAPKPAGVIFASVVTFVLVLFAIAGILRRRLRPNANADQI